MEQLYNVDKRWRNWLKSVKNWSQVTPVWLKVSNRLERLYKVGRNVQDLKLECNIDFKTGHRYPQCSIHPVGLWIRQVISAPTAETASVRLKWKKLYKVGARFQALQPTGIADHLITISCLCDRDLINLAAWASHLWCNALQKTSYFDTRPTEGWSASFNVKQHLASESEFELAFCSRQWTTCIESWKCRHV